MPFCPQCGKETSKNYNVCPFCRQVLRADSLLRTIEGTRIIGGSKGKLLVVATVVLLIGVSLGYMSSLPQIQTMENRTVELQSRVQELENQLALMTEVGHEVSVLRDTEYYSSVKDAIANADDTVFVAMYSMIYDPDDSFDWANELIRELVDAKTRGVDVRVFIEYRTYFDTMTRNSEAYSYLSTNGVAVKLDNEDDTDHMKFIVVDGMVVFVGSHNWSESSLYYNHEASVRIVSEEIAELFEDYFEEI